MMLQVHDEVVETIIDKYSDTIFKICMVYLKNKPDAEDALQEVFVKVIEKAPKFNSDNHQKAWIIRVASNHCRNVLKSKKYRIAVSLDENILADDSSTEDKEILHAIFNLPLDYRKVIYLYYYEGYSTKEIAAITAKRESTIRSNLKRAREKLKQGLGGDSFE